MFLSYIFGRQKGVHHLQEEEDKTMKIIFMTTCLNTQGMIVFWVFTLSTLGNFILIFFHFTFWKKWKGNINLFLTSLLILFQKIGMLYFCLNMNCRIYLIFAFSFFVWREEGGLQLIMMTMTFSTP